MSDKQSDTISATDALDQVFSVLVQLPKANRERVIRIVAVLLGVPMFAAPKLDTYTTLVPPNTFAVPRAALIGDDAEPTI